MTNEQKAARVLAACGRTPGEVGTYAKHVEALAEFCDDAGTVQPGAREAWRAAYQAVLADNKATDADAED